MTREVSRAVVRAGYRVRAGLGPRRLGALIRHVYTPHRGLDDLDGVTNPLDGFQPYRNTETSLHCPGSADEPAWFHAVATVPRDGWPHNEVGMRFLEDLVTGVSPATLRTIKCQYRLVAKRAAIARTLGSLVVNKAAVIGADKKGQTTTGEDEGQVDANERVLADLVRTPAAGVEPVVRVMVSATSPGELEEAKERIDSAFQTCQFTDWTWHDLRHHHAVALMLPLGQGVRAVDQEQQ